MAESTVGINGDGGGGKAVFQPMNGESAQCSVQSGAAILYSNGTG